MANMGFNIFQPVNTKQSYKDRRNQQHETRLEMLDKQQAHFAQIQRERQKRKGKQDNTAKGTKENEIN